MGNNGGAGVVAGGGGGVMSQSSKKWFQKSIKFKGYWGFGWIRLGIMVVQEQWTTECDVSVL